MTQPPCSPTDPSFLLSRGQHSPFFTLTASSLNQVALSRPASPSWDSWRNPDSTAQRSAGGTESPVARPGAGTWHAAHSTGEKECLPQLPGGRKERGRDRGKPIGKGKKGRGGERARVRASEETEQWSDSWGYICDDSDSSTHRRRAHRRTHTGGACGQRAALTLEMLTFRWKKAPMD